MSDVLRAAARDLEKKTARLMHVGCEAGAPLSEEWGDEWRALVADVRKMQHGLRAALDAGQAQPVAPAGWKLVPVEPTPEMVNAGGFADTEATDSYTGDFTHCIGDSAAREAYRAMLSAAPPAPAAQPLTADPKKPNAVHVPGYGYVDAEAVRAVERAHGIGAQP